MRNKILALTVIASVAMYSCGNDESSNTTTKDSTNTETNNKTSTDSGGDNSEVRANINLTLSGGDMAGSYTAACKDACCSWGIAGENVFGNQYSETGKGPKELSSVQLIVDDVKEGSKTTKEFTVTVSFGELFSETSKSFNINTRQGKSEGSGTLELQYQGDKATVSIKGVSKEGPSIDLKLECNKVITANNLLQ